MWIVSAADDQYGRFRNQFEADAFAAFLTEEGTPAKAENEPFTLGPLLSPVAALLAWRTGVTR